MKSTLLFFTLILSAAATSAFATPHSYTLDIKDINHFKGNSLESKSKSTWKNSTSEPLTLTFGREASVGNVSLIMPEGATAFITTLQPDEAAEITFDATGYYKFALSWDDGTIKTGELTVVSPEVVNIDIIGITFSPKIITVKRGQRIRWINTTGMAHTVTADPELARDPINAGVPVGANTFDSGNLAPGETFIMEFTVPGEYLYFCKPHESMGHVGIIIVE